MPQRTALPLPSASLRVAVLGLALFWTLAACIAHAADGRASDRQRMILEMIDNARAVGPVAGRPGISEPVLDVMGGIPRHAFVPEDQRRHAYDNRPLPIGYGQTISQPYIVALMTDLLDLDGQGTALEIGTGSGYQAAVLARLTRETYTIEIVPQLAQSAADRLDRLGFGNVMVQEGDGYYGWEEHAPFDAIVVTAAASHIPPPLIRQLKPGGKMVIPVGAAFFVQELMLVEKTADGQIRTRHLLPVRFVPLTGGH